MNVRWWWGNNRMWPDWELTDPTTHPATPTVHETVEPEPAPSGLLGPNGQPLPPTPPRPRPPVGFRSARP